MVLLKTICRPDKVDAVKDALLALGATGLTVTEVRGHGQQKGHTAVYRGQEYAVSLLPKMQIEVVLDDGAGQRGRTDAGEVRAAVRAHEFRLAGIPLGLAATFRADMPLERAHLRRDAALPGHRGRHAFRGHLDRQAGGFLRLAAVRWQVSGRGRHRARRGWRWSVGSSRARG